MKDRSRDIDVDKIRRQLREISPALYVAEAAGAICVRGTLPLEHGGEELDHFSIEVDLSPVRAGDLPIVREVGGRIPWTKDRHVNEDGSACVCLPEDYLQKHPGAFDLGEFLSGPVTSFFIGQALVDRGHEWPHGEWAHGEQGTGAWLQEFLESLTPKQLRDYLVVLADAEPKGHCWCPCGRRLRLSGCHLAFIRLLRRHISVEQARKHLEAGPRQRPAGRRA